MFKGFYEASDYLIRESDDFQSIQIRLFDRINEQTTFINFTPAQEESLRQWLNRRHENNN